MSSDYDPTPGVIISQFNSKSGYLKIILSQTTLSGTQLWYIDALTSDGRKSSKQYLSPAEAKQDFEHLREVLSEYEPRDFDN